MSLISGRPRQGGAVPGADCILIETPRNSMTKLTRSVDDVKRVIDASYVNTALSTLFPSLDGSARKRLAYRAETILHRAGETIFAEGEAPDGLHLIRRGTADIATGSLSSSRSCWVRSVMIMKKMIRRKTTSIIGVMFISISV